METTRKTVSDKLVPHLSHEIPVTALVEWVELAILDGEFETQYFDEVRNAVARIGVSDI